MAKIDKNGHFLGGVQKWGFSAKPENADKPACFWVKKGSKTPKNDDF